jgi:hypothetical protein
MRRKDKDRDDKKEKEVLLLKTLPEFLSTNRFAHQIHIPHLLQKTGKSDLMFCSFLLTILFFFFVAENGKDEHEKDNFIVDEAEEEDDEEAYFIKKGKAKKEKHQKRFLLHLSNRTFHIMPSRQNCHVLNRVVRGKE